MIKIDFNDDWTFFWSLVFALTLPVTVPLSIYCTWKFFKWLGKYL